MEPDDDARIHYEHAENDLLERIQCNIRNNIPHQFNNKKKKANQTWYRGFTQRYQQISPRAPEATSAARAQSSNKINVNKYSDILINEMKKYNFGAADLPKILAQKDKKQVGAIVNAERGNSCAHPADFFVPPMLMTPQMVDLLEL
ncbi:hypothetical protein ILUMI_08615 [Ignelater luminosus]|uniref:Uncharacterized protein n=1 Tax=Ignelater luminosus TaxID=2038154 RepID=A0A8K0D1B7_IGNLU|nr:hypothetical protein ILUMI_08615 [Ignelater luminosus]